MSQDRRQPGLVHSRPPGRDQPQSGAAEAAVVLPHTAEGCPLGRRSPSHHQQGSQAGSRLGKAKLLVAGAAPWRTHMWSAEHPRAQTVVDMLKHTTGTR